MLQVHLRADGTRDKDEANKQAMEFKLVCPECNREYWMDLLFVAGKTPDITVHTSPQMSQSENAKDVEPVRVFYSKEKRWWFSRKGERTLRSGLGSLQTRRHTEGSQISSAHLLFRATTLRATFLQITFT